MKRQLLAILLMTATMAMAAEESTALDARLERIFQQIPSMKEVQVSEAEGVVHLQGKVTSAEVAEKAVALAEKQDGVVWVRNDLSVPLGVENRLQPAIDKIGDIGSTVLAYLPLLGIALVVFLVFRWLGRWIAERQWWTKRLKLSSLGLVLARRVIRLVGLIVGLLLALEILDATAIVGAILGIAGVAGIALGFAFRNIVENYLAGIMLSARNPFEMGDFIEVAGQTGKVARLTSRDTVLISPDGNHIRLPNSFIISQELVNYSRNPQRRFEVRVGAEPNTDLRAALAIGLDALNGLDGVLAEPAPKGIVEALGDSTVGIVFYAWLDQRNNDLLKLRGEATVRVKEAFDEHQVAMPEPTYRIINVDTSVDIDNSPPSPPKKVQSQVSDVSRDDSLDKTLEEEINSKDEENLL